MFDLRYHEPGFQRIHSSALLLSIRNLIFSDTDTMCFTDLPLLIRPFLARRLRLAAGAEPSDVAELVLDTIRTFLTEVGLFGRRRKVEDLGGR